MSLQFTFVDTFMEKYMPQAATEAYKAERSNFDLWMDRGTKLKAMLTEVGFTDIKIWEQAMNLYHGDGAAFFTKGFGGTQLSRYLARLDISDSEKDKIREEAIAEWDKVAGKDTTDHPTFQVVVVLVRKPKKV